MHKARFLLTIPLEVDMTPLLMDDVDDFIDRNMSTPGNRDNGLSEQDNRDWFAKLWRSQVQLQQAMIADPARMAKFVQYIAADQICEAVQSVTLEDAVYAAADPELSNHFMSADEFCLDTSELVEDLLQACSVEIVAQPGEDIVRPA